MHLIPNSLSPSRMGLFQIAIGTYHLEASPIEIQAVHVSFLQYKYTYIRFQIPTQLVYIYLNVYYI